jgi:vacuolar protein sorting-associated protein VTA1
MASNIPPALKSADITRFVIRAAQVEKPKPVIAYWCKYCPDNACGMFINDHISGYYHIVNQLIAKGLHNVDADCLTYTTTMMDKLEEMKVENVGNDAVTDDVAGQAYVEQFGLETFSRADNAVRANKASRYTLFNQVSA